MTLVVLFSTLSFTVDRHYCGTTLVDISFFGEAGNCGMEMNKQTEFEGCAIDKKNCCTDVVVSIDGQHELQTSLETITFTQQVFLPAFVTVFILEIPNIDAKTIAFEERPPPLLIKNIQLLDAVFLI